MKWLVFPAAVLILLILLFRRKRIEKNFFVLFLLLDMAGAALLFSEWSSGGKNRVTELSRAELEEEGTIPLEVETDEGESLEVDVTVPEKIYSAEEIRELFNRTEAKLEKTILGKNRSPDRIEWNLNLPTSLPDSPVTIQWYTDRPDLVDFDGIVHEGPEKGGTNVLLTADLSLQNETRSWRKKLVLFPPKEEESIREAIIKEAARMNEGAEMSSVSSYILPEEAEGRKIRWYQKSDQRGAILCLLSLAGALLGVLAGREKKETEQRRRAEEMERDYPQIVSKIQLYLGAGMSMRAVFNLIAREYKKGLQKGNRRRAAFEEICRTSYRMESGVTEMAAYEDFGKHCDVPCYRSLSLMLTQNLKKGSSGLLPLLEREVHGAFETRKRRARSEGEKVTVKMLLPLFMMLTVVIALILIPAFMGF